MEMVVVGKRVRPAIPDSVIHEFHYALERAGFTQDEIRTLIVTPLLLQQVKQVLQGRISVIKPVPIKKECLEPYVPPIFCSIDRNRQSAPAPALAEQVMARGIDILVSDTAVFNRADEIDKNPEGIVHFVRLSASDFHFPAQRTYAPKILDPAMLKEWSERSLSGWEVSFCQPDDVLHIALLDTIGTLIRQPIRIAMSPVIINRSQEIFQLQYIGARLSVVPVPGGKKAVFPKHFPVLFRLSKIVSA